MPSLRVIEKRMGAQAMELVSAFARPQAISLSNKGETNFHLLAN
jgi:hypothetical protein